MTKVVKPDDWNAAFTLVYDAWNRLVIVKDGETVVATYFYDGLNRRVKKVTAVETRGFLYNRNWQCIDERVGDFSMMQIRYLWGLRYVDDLVFRERDTKEIPSGSINERRYALHDANWNIVAMGTPNEHFTYNAFGKVNCFNSAWGAKSAPAYTDRLFTGQILDAETGLMLYRNRVYHPTLGRFVQRDPIGYESQDVNLYRYADNMPCLLTDTYGLQASNATCPASVGAYYANAYAAAATAAEKEAVLKALIDYIALTCCATDVARIEAIKIIEGTDVKVDSISIPIPLTKEKTKPRETCLTKYPWYDDCSRFSFYSKESAFNAVKIRTGITKLKHTDKNNPATECTAVKYSMPGAKGTHSKAMLGSVCKATILCCPCCEETFKGPMLRDKQPKCLINLK